MIRSTKNLLPLIWGILLLVSCAKKLTETDRQKLPKRKEKDLIKVLDSISDIHPNWFYTKIGTKFTDTNRNINFKTSIRLTQDSAINALITYATLPVVSAMITKDSVVISNKKDKCYIRQSVSYIKENFAVDFDHRNIEELLLGMPLDFDSTQKYFQINDPYNYIISSHKKRELRRNERGKEDIVIQYFLNDDARGLKAMQIDSPSDTASIRVDYLQREMIDGYDIPKEVLVQIKSARNHMLIEMSYDKIEINEPKEMILVIPESYGKCEE
ncbi:MAG: DUF4292 domain-containing protein [Bacteroidota bacterium]|jgi:hypothetical protein